MSIERTKEEQQRANEMFDALRDELLKRELSNTESYDRGILTLSAASLGISLTAIRFVVPLERADYIWMVKSGWVLLLISIIISLYAYFMSNKAISAQMKNAEDYYTHGVDEAFNRSNKYISFNSWLNKLTGVTFSLAIALIVLFVTININQENPEMSKKKDSSCTTTTFKDSAGVPNMQRVPSGTGLEKNSANIPTMQQAPGTQTSTQSGGSNSGGSNSSSGSSDNSGK